MFGSTLAKNGVVIRPAGLEAPEQIGRVERRGAMLKKIMSKVIKDTHASGRESKDMILGDCLSSYRTKACESFVRWDLDERARRAASTNVAPLLGSFQVSDMVLCCREARAGEHGLQWSVGSRLIGFERDDNSFGGTQSRTCWVINDSVPVCVAVDRLRPCTPAEL